jgi:hypothetical protein
MLEQRGTHANLNVLGVVRQLQFFIAGIFYDDPESTPAAQCRSRAGVVLTEDQVASVGLPVMELTNQSVMMTEFPYFSILSILLAVSKVYPALKKLCAGGAKISGTVVEVYDRAQKKIVYYALKRDA